ncbi:MAG: hypothetical protein AAF585_29450, partial [Verrucomicrobiota bacterium]
MKRALSATCVAALAFAAEVCSQADAVWGELEVIPIFIDAPEQLLQLQGAPSQKTDWSFPGFNAAQIERVMLQAGLTDEQMQRLSKEGCIVGGDGEIRVFPPADIVSAISPDGRARLYRALARFEENHYQANPVVIEYGPPGASRAPSRGRGRAAWRGCRLLAARGRRGRSAAAAGRATRAP